MCLTPLSIFFYNRWQLQLYNYKINKVLILATRSAKIFMSPSPSFWGRHTVFILSVRHQKFCMHNFSASPTKLHFKQNFLRHIACLLITHMENCISLWQLDWTIFEGVNALLDLQLFHQNVCMCNSSILSEFLKTLCMPANYCMENYIYMYSSLIELFLKEWFPLSTYNIA